MKFNSTKYYEKIKNSLLEGCTECGLCVSKCPIIKHTDLSTQSPREIQKEVLFFFKTGKMTNTAYTRAYSCMECFRCIDKHCPKGFNPMLINEVIKWKNRESPKEEKEDEFITHKILSSIQLSKSDQQRIFSESKNQNVKYVFFPGCNIYKQPEKILNALDILDMITKDYAFIPGLDYCCGDIHNFSGNPQRAAEVSRKLFNKISSYSPLKLILWCPTCICRFHVINPLEDLPFETITFSQFIAEHMNKLKFIKAMHKTVTLHEACKTSYTRIDLTSLRSILNKIPGINLIEMNHHGENTMCCGSGASTWFPESFNKIKSNRLNEAKETRADILVDVCHFCHEVFLTEEFKYGFKVDNYIHLVAEALGIHREDKFKKYKQLKDIDKILEDADELIKDSPYPLEQILSVLINEFSS